MSLSRVKTWSNEVLTASDLNAEFNNILNYLNGSEILAVDALSASNDDIIQRKAGAWATRTMAQLQADLITSGTITLNFAASGSPFNADQTCDVRWVKFGKEVTLHFERLVETANGTPSPFATAQGTPLADLIPWNATDTIGNDSTQSFWAPVTGIVSGSTAIQNAATVAIDGTGAVSIIKSSAWATSNLNGWSSFSISYQLP